MLDSLLVLGQVPGTDINITFNEILIAAILSGSAFYLTRRGSLQLKSRWLDIYASLRRLSQLPLDFGRNNLSVISKLF